ncbi:M48 family metallopeptidase [Myxococcaceae bacterium GXIMD 01537]
MRRLLTCLLLLLAAARCATVSQATKPITQPLGSALLSRDEEQRLGDELAAQVRQQEKVLDDAAVQEYVTRVGERVASTIRAEPQFRYTFTVLDEPEQVNAFALPGGHIFVYSGLLRAARNEAELASVLGHEIAHVTSGHARDMLAAQVGTQQLQALVLGQNPNMLAQIASQVAATGYLAAHSREAETEADSRGLNYLAAAGYEPGAMVSFFEELARMSGSSPDLVSQFVASHPDPGDRAKAIQQLIRERGLTGGKDSLIGDFDQMRARVGGPTKAGAREVPTPAEAWSARP